MDNSIDIQAITEACKPLPSVAITYLSKRGIKASEDWKFIYDYKVNDLQHIKISIAIPIRNLTNKIQGYEFRPLSKLASDRYSKSFSKNLIPMYKVIDRYSKKVVAVEGAVDCESIYQHSNLNVIALLKATPSSYILHTVAFLYQEIHLVLDNDEVGTKGAKKFKSFFRKHYPEIEVIIHNIEDYNKTCKDPNDLLVKDKKAFKKLVRDLNKHKEIK